ncbi:hypothetical protein ACFL3V_05690 [Nanoarchaeota archaeon]
MPKRIPKETKEEIMRLRHDGLSRSKITRQTGVSYYSVYCMTRDRQRINPETGRPFESQSQLRDYQVRQNINPETDRPFESRSQYEKYLARQRINPETGRPFRSRKQLRDYQVRQRINPETDRPFESQKQYQEYTAKQRQKRPENQELSDLIRKRLKKLGKDQAWLAGEMGITCQAVSSYVKCRHIPRKALLEQLFSALDVPYRTMDDLLE